MVSIPFCGGAYADKTLNANAQECVNLYPVLSPSSGLGPRGQSDRVVLYPTPGYRLMYDVVVSSGLDGVGAVRGGFVINSVLYVVSGTRLLRVVASGSGYTCAALGTLLTSSGRCSVSCNNVELTISDGPYGYVYDLSTGLFTQIAVAGSWPAAGVTNLAFLDGYTLAAALGTARVIQSDLLDSGTYGALAFADVNSFPDNVTAVFSDQLQLYVFGPKLTEVRYDAASTPFAFAKVGGVLIQAGCVAWPTVVKVGGGMVWLAQDYAGKAYVAQLGGSGSGYSTTVLSTPPINEAMERYATLADAFAHTYREGDSQFYCLTFPTADVTWVLDVGTKMWHRRSVRGGRDLPDHVFFWNDSHVAGDSTGKLWLMSQDYTTDDRGDGLRRVRACQHVGSEDRGTFLDELHVDVEAGTAPLDGVNPAAPPASAAQATLEVSKDRGHTWVTVGTKDFGAQGQYAKRLTWRRLGYSRNGWTFRLTVTDSVRVYILGAFAKIRAATK